MRNITSLILNIFVIGLVSVTSLYAQTDRSSILKQKIKIDPRFHASIWSAVHLLADQKIPIGFEAREHWDVDTDKKLSLESGTLEDVLNSMVKQDSFYTWSEEDGVINITPSDDRNALFSFLLSSRFGPVTVMAGEERASAVKKVAVLLHGKGLSNVLCSSVIGEGNSLGLPDRFSSQIDLSDSNLRTVLNSLIRDQPFRPIWSITKGIKPEEIVISF